MEDTFAQLFGDHGMHAAGRPVKAPTIERKLPCSLQELYKGTTKKMKISREIADASGKTIPAEEILTIDVKPGWKKGTKITFPEKGNEQRNLIAADLVFIIDEKPHPVFTRDGNDLVMTQKIPLAEALTGYTVHLTTLDGRSLTIPINSVINPGYEEVVRGKGMLIPKDPSKKGNLRIKFDIKFPTSLSDPQKRAVYDQYGEEGLKGQVPPPGAGGAGPGGAMFFSTGGDGPTVFRFNPRNADDIFAEFFGSFSPFGGMGGGMGGSMGGAPGMQTGGTRFSSSIFGDDIFGSAFGGGADGHHGMHATGRPVKAPAIERKLPCSLEELYKGTTKKMKISREIADASGKTIPAEEILTIDVKPGWKKGTKITFPEKGNEQRNLIPADLVFIIDEKPHPVFTRDGNDLVVTQKILLAEALTGYTVHLTTLDGRSLTIPINSVINPGYEEVVRGKGMPIPKDPSKKGNLRIKFDIKFPTRLTADKSGVKRLLGQ